MRIHGWEIHCHPCFQGQLANLLADARQAVVRWPANFRSSNAFKMLAAVARLAFDEIPQDPADPRFRQGSALGESHKHWFRAKFFQQYRLFFRYNEKARIIIYAWVNDEHTLRAYGSKSDAYKVFAGMLKNGNPPDDWASLKKALTPERELAELVAALGEVHRRERE